MFSTYTTTDPWQPHPTDYAVSCWQGGWIVYKGSERRWPVAAGFSSSQAAEDWIAEQSQEEPNE